VKGSRCSLVNETPLTHSFVLHMRLYAIVPRLTLLLEQQEISAVNTEFPRKIGSIGKIAAFNPPRQILIYPTFTHTDPLRAVHK